MNIVFLVNHDLAALLALNILLPKLSEHSTHILFTKKSRDTSGMPKALACLTGFDAKLVERSAKLNSFTKLDARQADDVNGLDFKHLQSLRPELIISIRHMTILRQACIDLPSLGVLNLHSGELPKYQGVMASFWAMLHQEKELATTLHRIEDSSIDTGQIIASSRTTADYQKSYFWNVLNLYQSGCDNILACIDALNQNLALPQAPQEGPANYFSYPTQSEIDKADFRLFSSSDNADSFI